MRGNVSIYDYPQVIHAEGIDYSQDSSKGIAFGNVTWIDTASNITVECQKADYDQKQGYIEATGQALLTTTLDGDTLWLTADTLLSVQQADSSRLLNAYRHVKIYKSDLQAVCDSLVYAAQDSLFRFFHNPVIWSDTSQFSADTITVIMRNNQINQIDLFQNAFIINTPDLKYFNQIKGKDIIAYFKASQLSRMNVQGNGESVYYALDDRKKYFGINKTICSDMLLYFGNNQVNNIRFYTQPKATFSPMKQVNHETLKIKGFNWQLNKRPMSKEDLLK